MIPKKIKIEEINIEKLDVPKSSLFDSDRILIKE